MIGANRELKTIWLNVEKCQLTKVSLDNGTEWVFGPPDSSWHQGAVESLVKSAKRCIHYAIADRKMSVSEFLTICAHVSNILNERPIGLMSASDSEINIFTPNCLLIGRPIATQPGVVYSSPKYSLVLFRKHD